jgi:hypothetical protein
VLLGTQVQSLVSAMAAFPAPAAATTGGASAQRTAPIDLAVGATL